MSQTRLILLGTGSPNLFPNRYQSSLAILVDDTPYIIDCGGGTLQRIAEAYGTLHIEALEFTKLTRLFITHLHPDHTVGIADFMIAPWVKHRTEALHIFGPAGTQKMCSLLLEAHQIGMHEHLYGSVPIDDPLQVSATDIDAGQIYQDDKVRVVAFRVQHGSLNAFGYKFYTPDKTIVVSGDTCFVPVMIEQARGCDILVHEVYSSAQLPQRPAGWQHYHSTVHTGTLELAKIAQEAQPKKLVLTHQLFWDNNPESLLTEMQQLYSGSIINGQDLMIIE